MNAATTLTPPATRLLTAEDLWAMPEHGGHCELVKGELIEMPPAGAEHGATAFDLGVHLGNFVRTHRLGRVCAAKTGFILARNPDTVRAPDVAFVAAERLPSPLPTNFLELAPDLVVEVVSPGDTAQEVEDKVADWLTAGTRLVWVIYPRSRMVHVHRPHAPSRRLTAADALDGEDVVPGFSCPVMDLFA